MTRAMRLACPECGQTDSLATEERLIGIAAIEGVRRESSTVAWSGETDVLWDSSVTTGVRCWNCDWSADYDEAEDGLLGAFLATVLAVPEQEEE